jgi:hypothetical protein
MAIKHNYKNKIWNCLYCGKEFKDNHACLTRIPKFCSNYCSAKILSKNLTEKRLKALELGRVSRGSKLKGRKLTEEHRLNISKGKLNKKLSLSHRKELSKARIGKFNNEKSFSWKGDNVGYGGLHDWVKKKLGKSKICEMCGNSRESKQMHWANKSGEYKREICDWIRLCIICHKKYDKINNIHKHERFKNEKT